MKRIGMVWPLVLALVALVVFDVLRWRRSGARTAETSA